MDELEKLRQENDELMDKIIDQTFDLKNSKEMVLLEFLQELYNSLLNVDEKLTKEDIIKNLKKYIENFVKDNKLNLN